MDFRELEYVLVIAQEQNLSRAAERLHITQPALSRFLLKLEDQLSVELFERKNRRYVPTDAGELYLAMARDILTRQQRFQSELKQSLASQVGSLSIGITPGRGHTLLPKILPAFQKEFPDYELKIHEEDVDTLERYLRDGTVTIAFFPVVEGGAKRDRKMVYELIHQEEIVLCAAKESNYRMLSIADKNRKYPWIDIEAFENENFMLLKSSMRLGQYAKEIMERWQIYPRTVEFSSIDTVLALTANQYGVAFASDFRIEEHEMFEQLDLFSFGQEPEKWDFVAAYQKDCRMPHPARQMIRLVKDICNRDAL